MNTERVNAGRRIASQNTDDWSIGTAVSWLKTRALVLAQADREHPDTIDYYRGQVLGAIDVLEAAQSREMAQRAVLR